MAAALALAGMPLPGVAQAPASAVVAIEEIVVTARKEEESLRSLPVAVTAFSAETIEDFGLAGISDISRFTPGFSLNSALGRQPASYRPVFRGVTTVRNGIGNATAGAAFVDGVYVGAALLTTELSNVERVEVMRGPQSAQWGRNTYMGAINYVTRRPSEEFQAEITATGAQHGTADAAGWISGPLGSPQFLFYIGAGHREYDGEWENTLDGSDIGGEESDEVIAKLLFQPLETLDVTLKAGIQATDDDHFAMYLQPATLNNCCERTAEAPRAREYYVGKAVLQEQVTLFTPQLEANGGAGTELDRALGSLTINWRFGGFTLTSLTGIISDDVELGFDSSYAGYDPSVVPFQPAGSFLIREEKEFDDVSQELRLLSPRDRALRATAGIYFYDGELDTVSRRRIDPATAIATDEPLSRDEVENTAVFGAVDWDFAEHWTAGVELRWAEDDVIVTSLPVGAPSQVFDEDFDSLTPRFTLAWRAQENTTYYLSAAKGTKPGDFNPRVPCVDPAQPAVGDESRRAVDEESAWNYELGLKSRLWDERLTAGLAGYYVEVTDQQVTELVENPCGGTLSLLRNSGRTEILGLEAELAAELTAGLTLSATYAYTDSEIDRWISQEEADLRGSDGSATDNERLGDVSDRQSPRVPQHTASLVARYERGVGEGLRWYGSADYSYESSKYAAEHNLIETGDRSLVGARTGLATESWDLSLWVRNLFDDETPVDVIRYFDRRSGPLPSFPQAGSPPSSTPRGFAIPLPPGRQAGLTLRYRF